MNFLLISCVGCLSIGAICLIALVILMQLDGSIVWMKRIHRIMEAQFIAALIFIICFLLSRFVMEMM